MCHLYGLDENDVKYMLETFYALRRHEYAIYGEYRTARFVQSTFASMRDAS